MEEARRGPSAVTRRVGLIKTKRNRKAIIRKGEIRRVTMGFTLLTSSGCASVTRVVFLIPHITLYYMIYGTPVLKTINPSPFLIPMYFNRKW